MRSRRLQIADNIYVLGRTAQYAAAVQIDDRRAFSLSRHAEANAGTRQGKWQRIGDDVTRLDIQVG
jgi:hypothetical protein